MKPIPLPILTFFAVFLLWEAWLWFDEHRQAKPQPGPEPKPEKPFDPRAFMRKTMAEGIDNFVADGATDPQAEWDRIVERLQKNWAWPHVKEAMFAERDYFFDRFEHTLTWQRAMSELLGRRFTREDVKKFDAAFRAYSLFKED